MLPCRYGRRRSTHQVTLPGKNAPGGAVCIRYNVTTSSSLSSVVTQGHLALVVDAVDGLAPLLRLAQRRQEQARQNGDDGDDHKQFDQSEAALAALRCVQFHGRFFLAR